VQIRLPAGAHLIVQGETLPLELVCVSLCTVKRNCVGELSIRLLGVALPGWCVRAIC